MVLLALAVLVVPMVCLAQPQFEFENNWLMWLSFVSGVDEGIEKNLDDNFGWMQAQGYTHLRFFGILPTGVHTFPSPTLDTNGYPNSPMHEAVLPILVNKADQYGITINFDGWEVIAESNSDTTRLGVGYVTADELRLVVAEVLSYGIDLVTEEQFGSTYLEAIQTATSQAGARHETTSLLWWQTPGIADEQLSSVFNFYHYDQAELDTLDSFPPSNLGNLHIDAESARYFGYPLSVAVGSFGSLEAANWKNVLLNAQIQHLPDRFSVEEQNTDFTIWDPEFNFMEDVGNEILALAPKAFGERPIVNLVIDLSSIYDPPFYPAWYALTADGPAIANTFTLLGYRVILTKDSFLPDADMYYLLVAGGADPTLMAPLPGYAMTLLNGDKPVFLHPSYGIPDENDSPSWTEARNLFGLPAGDTETYGNAIPDTVTFDSATLLWGGVSLWMLPILEMIPSAQIDSEVATVVLSGDVAGEDIALVVRNANRFLINSNMIHLEAAFVLSSLLGGPLNSPATADIAFDVDKALIFAEYDTNIDLSLPWTGTTHVMRYDPQGIKVDDSVSDLGGHYNQTLARGELVVMTSETPTSIEDGAPAHLARPELFQSYPNPFNPTATIRYRVPSPGIDVQLGVFDAAGRVVVKLVDDFKPGGTYAIEWNGRNKSGASVASGVYFVRMIAGEYTGCDKIVLLR
jgi:hypothetical protein